MRIQKNIAKMLRAAKKESHLNMDEFSKKMSVSRTIMQSYLSESGRANPTVNTLELLADRLNIPVEELILGPGAIQCPPGCKTCLRFEVETLHPRLREPARQYLALFSELSNMLYELEKQS